MAEMVAKLAVFRRKAEAAREEQEEYRSRAKARAACLRAVLDDGLSRGGGGVDRSATKSILRNARSPISDRRDDFLNSSSLDGRARRGREESPSGDDAEAPPRSSRRTDPQQIDAAAVLAAAKRRDLLHQDISSDKRKPLPKYLEEAKEKSIQLVGKVALLADVGTPGSSSKQRPSKKIGGKK